MHYHFTVALLCFAILFIFSNNLTNNLVQSTVLINNHNQQTISNNDKQTTTTPELTTTPDWHSLINSEPPISDILLNLKQNNPTTKVLFSPTQTLPTTTTTTTQTIQNPTESTLLAQKNFPPTSELPSSTPTDGFLNNNPRNKSIWLHQKQQISSAETDSDVKKGQLSKLSTVYKFQPSSTTNSNEPINEELDGATQTKFITKVTSHSQDYSINQQNETITTAATSFSTPTRVTTLSTTDSDEQRFSTVLDKFLSDDDDSLPRLTSPTSTTTTTTDQLSTTSNYKPFHQTSNNSRLNSTDISQSLTPSNQDEERNHNTTSKPQETSTATTTSAPRTSDVHPLLIYSVRYEIRSYDLFNPSNSLSVNSQAQQINSRPLMSNSFQAKSAKSSLAQNANSNLASSPTQTFESQQAVGATTGQQHNLGHSKHSKTLLAGLKNTIGLDFYYSESNSYIFWADVVEERIYKGIIFNGSITNIDVLVQGGLSTAEGLAVDWVAKNIYWVESTLDHIEVADLNGNSRRTLIAGDMESPRAIAVDPRLGLIFWSDWDKKSPRIERATMSGDDRRTLVNIKEVHGGWPNGLTLDYDYYKIYWIDANSDSIHVVDYEGNKQQQILKQFKSLGHPFSITLYQNNLYWADWKTNSISSANKYTGADARELQRLNNRLFDIKVFHPSRQPKLDDDLNPCLLNNGFCSHLCLLSVNHTRKCECPNLMKLAPDGKNCVMSEKVLLIGRTSEIRAVDMYKPLYHIMAPISVPKVFVPKQFEFDAKSRSIFWADSSTNEVKRTQLAGNTIDTILDVIVEQPSGLALDWISRNIYVTSSFNNKVPGKIYISNTEGEFISVLMDYPSDGIVSPKSIAVHPVLGLLFCIDEGSHSDDGVIFMANMDGSEKQIISSKTKNPHHSGPASLSIDYELDRVYWVNQGEKTSDNCSIQYYDIRYGVVFTLLDESVTQEKINPTVLCVDGDSLIVGARIPSDAIIRISVNDVTNKTILRTQNLDQLSALRVYNSSIQVGSNLCSINNGNCSQLCIPTNSDGSFTKHSRTCKCTMGYTNNPANQSECIGKDEFLIYSYNLGMKGVGLEPKSSPEEYYLPPIHRAFRASSIDFVHRDNLIYWVDNEEGSITRINRDTTNYKLIVQGLESEESIAIDWVAGNLYWLDPYYDIIEVARLNGSNRYVIVSGDMEKPNGIVVNPLKGYIAWSDAGSNYPRIEVAQLDGSNRRSVVKSNLSHVDDLAIDYIENYIYWVDSSLALVERIKPDGTNRQVVYSSKINNHLVSIAIYKDYLYIADAVQNHGSIIRCDRNAARLVQAGFEPHSWNACTEIIQDLGEGIRDVAIFAQQLMPPSSNENPCMTYNGGCQDLCLFMGKPGKRRCICSHGKLEADGVTCKPFDTFVLFSKLTQIDSLHIMDEFSSNNSPYLPIVMENRSFIISLTVDYKSQRVIYSDMSRDHIASVYFNGTDKRVLIEKQSLVEGIAFANDQLFWTNINDFTISRLNVTSTPSSPLQPSGKVEKIIRLSFDDKPRGIVVDQCTSYVYWTNWNTNACIQRASPHNGYKIESIIKTNIKVPNGITIDQSLRRLYWCDARLDKIEACDMDGTNRVVLISALPQHPFALAIWDNYVFWTDWIAKGVFKADKMTGQHPVQIKKVAQRPMGIAVAAEQNFVCPIDHCTNNNGGCPPKTICVMRYPDHKSTGYVDCKVRDSILHDLKLPRCKHAKDGSFCEFSSYHDIITNSMERYNTTDLYPLEWSPATRQNVVDEASNIGTGVVISSTTEQPTTMSLISTTTTTTTTTTVTSTSVPQTTTTTTLSSSTTTASPSVASSTGTPCQITPAALQPTTDTNPSETCKIPGEFKCYLSEKLICISSDRRCDGNHDCPSKEDENDCYLSKRAGGSSFNLGIREASNWHRFGTVVLVILGAAVAALFLVFGSKGRRRWFVVGSNGAFNHTRMFDDNGTNIEISNPMFEEDDTGNLNNCPFSIDLNETTNFSNPLYERVLLMNDKHSNNNK